MSAGSTFPEVLKANNAAEEPPRKLNIGAGQYPLDGYRNIDRQYTEADDNSPAKDCQRAEAYPLKFIGGIYDEVRASHVLEHFSHRQSLDVLREWVRVLKPGGILKIAVPDFKWIAEKYLAGEDIPVQGYVMGGHVDENDHHGTVYDEDCLREQLEAAGLTNITRWESDVQDCASLPVSLNLMGVKPSGMGILSRINDWETAGKPEQHVSDRAKAETAEVLHELAADAFPAPETNIIHPERMSRFPDGMVQACLSSSRLMFADTIVSCFSALVPLNVKLEINTGVFWGQALTLMMQTHLNDGTKYILTLDFDTLFTQDDVLGLARLMELRPDIDALCSVQMGRERNTPLLTMTSKAGTNLQTISAEEMDAEVMRVNSAHFGLTMIRVDSLKKAKKPWFHHQPDANGEWGPEHMDEDVYFWHNWKHSGLTLYQANRIAIGHLQIVATWPTVGLTPHFQYLNQWYSDGKPKEAHT